MKESSDNKPQKLEDIFRQRLEEAEVAPSDRVWERIAQGLDSKEAGYYKERVGWYRSLAAACIFLVVCAAGYLFYDFNHAHTTQNTIAQQPANAPETVSSNKKTTSALAQTQNTPPKTLPLPAARELALNNPVSKNQKVLPAAGNTSRSRPINSGADKVVSGEGPIPDGRSESNAFALTQSNNSVSPNGAQESELPGRITASGPGQISEALESIVPVLVPGVSKTLVLAEIRPLPEKANAASNMLALLSEPAADQNNKARTGRWSLSAKYAPHYFNQNIQLGPQSNNTFAQSSGNLASFSAPNAGNVASNSYTQALNEYDNNISPGYSYNTAVVAGYILNEHWSLESGLNFTQNVAASNTSFIFNNTNLAARYNLAPQNLKQNDTKQNIDPIAVLPATALLASLSGQQSINAATVVPTPTFETQYRYRMVGIPLRLNYQTSQRKSFYFASVGFLTNMLVQAHVLSSSSKVPDLKYQGQADSPFRTWQVAATVSAGKGFRISKAVNLRAGIEGTQNLSSLVANPENLPNGKGKPYTIGVAFSSSYTLGL